MHKARKLFRLLKTFNEINTISNKIRTHKQDEFGNSFSVLSRLGYLFYWIFDNIGTLVDLKVIKIARDREQITNIGLRFKIVGLVLGLILAFRNWIHAAHK